MTVQYAIRDQLKAIDRVLSAEEESGGLHTARKHLLRVVDEHIQSQSVMFLHTRIRSAMVELGAEMAQTSEENWHIINLPNLYVDSDWERTGIEARFSVIRDARRILAKCVDAVFSVADVGDCDE